LAFAFEAPRISVISTTPASARSEPGEPARDAPGRLGADRLCQGREPLADRGGVVVDDVEDPGHAALQRKSSRGRGVVEVDKRPDAAPVTDEREAPLAHELDLRVVR
jgi:hypothetical protein